MICMPGCEGSGDQTDETGADGGEESEKPADPYDEYIRSAIETVNGDDPAAGSGATPTSVSNVPGRAVAVENATPADIQVSSMEDPDTSSDPFYSAEDPFATETPEPSPTVDPNATPTPEPTPYITPEEFDVGKCCIYMNGESDSAYGTEIISAINKARTDLGYPPLITNKGLTTCADRRTRESAANFSHTRPNGEFFTSLAPEHFKAEMLIIDNQKAENTVDALIKRDPISRNLIFTEKYQSIGASSFKTNGMRYSVVSFGL